MSRRKWAALLLVIFALLRYVASKIIFTPVLNNLLVIISFIIYVVAAILVIVNITRSDEYEGAVRFFIFITVFLTLPLNFAVITDSMAKIKTFDSFTYNNSTYYITNSGFKDWGTTIYQEDGPLTMREIQWYKIKLPNSDELTEEAKVKIIEGIY